MFSIICRTCAARLKVRNEAAIGQRLACPKCGEMVLVSPPADWRPTPPAIPSGSSSSDSSSHAAGNDFEDIDQIIGGPTTPSKPAPSKAAPPQASSSQKPAPPGSSRQKRVSPAPGRPAADGQGPGSQRIASPGTGAEPSNAPGRVQTGKASGHREGKEQRTVPEANPASAPESHRGAVTKSSASQSAASQSSTSPGLQPVDPVVAAAAAKPPLAPRDDQFELTQPREYLPDANLPPPDWTAKKSPRGQAFLVGSLLFIGLIGVIAAIIALLNQSPDAAQEKVIAQGEPAPVPAAQPNPTEEPQPSEGEPSSPEENDSGAQTSPETEVADAVAKSGDQSSAPQPEQKAAEVPSNLDDSSTKPETSLPGNSERPVSPQIPESNPLPNAAENPSENPVVGTAEAEVGAESTAGNVPSGVSLTDRLGKLSQLLSGPGTSLTELGDLAQSERTDRLVGLPRYLISQPEPLAPPTDPGSIPIAEIEYRDTPLHLFLSELSSLSGVTFCLDALALSRAGISVDTPMSIQLTDTTFGEVIAQVLTSLKLEQSTVEGVQWIQPAGAQVTQTYRFPLPKVSEPTQEKYERLAANLPKLIDQVSWTLDSANRKASIEGAELVISNSSLAAGEVEEFLNKLNAAQAVKANQADLAAAETLKSRTARAANGLNQTLALAPTLDQPLEQFLQRVYRETGVAITVDWAALAGAGWTNRSMVPGDFRADTVELLLKELARSLACTWLAIDEHTFQLTSFNEASRRQFVEVHSLEGLAIEAQPLMEILTQTLGGELRESPMVQFLYEPEANALIVVGPQPLQRQFEAIVNRLKQPVNR